MNTKSYKIDFFSYNGRGGKEGVFFHKLLGDSRFIKKKKKSTKKSK